MKQSRSRKQKQRVEVETAMATSGLPCLLRLDIELDCPAGVDGYVE